MDSTTTLRVDMGFYMGTILVKAPTKLLIKDSCPFGQTAILTVAQFGRCIYSLALAKSSTNTWSLTQLYHGLKFHHVLQQDKTIHDAKKEEKSEP